MNPAPSRGTLIARRVVQRLGIYSAVAASLLIFPSALPWMILGWLVAFGVRLAKGRPGWPPLGILLAVVLVKRVDWTPGLIALGVLVLAAGVLDYYRDRMPGIPRHRFASVALAVLGLAWGWMALEWSAAGRTSRRAVIEPGRPIVCVGDSITIMGYPRELAKYVAVPVIDKAVGGTSAAECLKTFPEALALKPQTVVIEVGGHDYVRRRPRREVQADLERMILDARAAGAEVVLFEIPRGFVVDAYAGLERELARRYDLELIGDGAIRQLVLFSRATPLGRTGRRLSDDGLHPNADGNVFLAGLVGRALDRIYGESIRSRR